MFLGPSEQHRVADFHEVANMNPFDDGRYAHRQMLATHRTQ
jgi:hypothetical protein